MLADYASKVNISITKKIPDVIFYRNEFRFKLRFFISLCNFYFFNHHTTLTDQINAIYIHASHSLRRPAGIIFIESYIVTSRRFANKK